MEVVEEYFGRIVSAMTARGCKDADSGILSSRRRRYCKECQGSGICEHGRQKACGRWRERYL
jgi:hypothetical protein